MGILFDLVEMRAPTGSQWRAHSNGMVRENLRSGSVLMVTWCNKDVMLIETYKTTLRLYELLDGGSEHSPKKS